eukprot:720192-Prymnesium_polylepis.1
MSCFCPPSTASAANHRFETVSRMGPSAGVRFSAGVRSSAGIRVGQPRLPSWQPGLPYGGSWQLGWGSWQPRVRNRGSQGIGVVAGEGRGSHGLGTVAAKGLEWWQLTLRRRERARDVARARVEQARDDHLPNMEGGESGSRQRAGRRERNKGGGGGA